MLLLQRTVREVKGLQPSIGLGVWLWVRAAKEKRPMEVGAGSKEGGDRRIKSGGAG